MTNTKDDIYSKKILNRNTLYGYSSIPHYRKNIDNYITTRNYYHKQDMYNISFDENKGSHFNFTKYQKTNHLHNNNYNVANRIFNSCIYTNSEEGKIGCINENKLLFQDYINKNQKYNFNILKSTDNDIDDKKFGNMFYNNNNLNI